MLMAPTELLEHFPLHDQLLRGEILKRYFEQSIRLARCIPVTSMSKPSSFTELKEFVNKRIRK
jgi:hypothetical protein